MPPATRLTAAALARRLGPVVDDRGPGAGATAGPTTGSTGARPAGYRELAHRIRGAVLDGRIPVDTGLPSERDLAAGLAVSRTTVAAAYALLRDQGWLDSRRGSGSRLRLPDADAGASRTAAGPAGIFGYRRPDGPELIDLSTASLPAAEEPVMAAVRSATAALPALLASDGYQPFGLPALRAVIAERYTADGVPTTAEQILVTNGAQHAFTLAMAELSLPGDRVLIECPTYPVALDAIRAQRRVPEPIGLVDAGAGGTWDAELLATQLRRSAPRLGYLIPDFQNPTGALMDLPTREHVVSAARASGTVLVVDESFRDLPFTTTGPLPPRMAALTDDTRVVSLGSVSKSLWGGLRVGWIRAARPLVERLAATRARGDMSGPVLEQLVAAELLAAPDQALRIQRERLTRGVLALRGSLERHVPDWRASRPLGGGFCWIELPGPWASELARLAPSAGVSIAPGPRFGPDGTMESFLRLPFTQPADRLDTAVQRLAAIAGRAAAARTSVMPGWLA
ncbi:MocR-like transcription factor YczR [Nakamurella endophytica]|uniref:GntR family transcriptional regulator n=1 Tax=Nakamurella endophytica TaxID=1748367 RepID=A0A917T952_9ACTN|nr:PLP-dependent aminotransferase family protein [Nakamurella endophytica]GGM14052.1 GntR family transcriptional regulator [Nakamurella endophytica]